MKTRLFFVIPVAVIVCLFVLAGCHKPTDPDDPADLELTEETEVIDPDQTTISQVSPNQVVINGTADYQSGDVIVSEVSTAAPSGILRKVQSVTVQGNQTILTTVPATLEDVFENADILVNQALSTKDIKESRVLTNGVFFVPDAKNDEKFSYDINKQITLPTGQVMSITGSLGAENSFDFDLKIRNKNISFLKYTHIAEQSSELAVSVNNSYDYSHDFDLYEHTFYPFTVWIGPVPLVFIPKIKVVLNVSASGEAGVSTSITQTATVSAGLQLQDGQWSTFSDEDISFDFQPPQLTNELSVSVGAGPDLSLMLFGVVGPYANTRGSLVLAADLMNTPWWTLTGKVTIDGGIMFDALGVEADYSSNFLNYSHVIAQATQNQCATPLFDPPEGSYPNTQTVSISCATPNATIKYTTNGSDPNSSSPVYSNPITVSQNTTLKAKATKSGWTDSSIATADYTISPIQTVATPTFNPAGGTYTTAQNVQISCTTPGATIFYSTNGSTPSIQYTGPVNIASTTTLKAKATKSGWTDSQIASAIYTINIQPNTVTTPTFSPPGGPYTSAQSVQINCTTSGAVIHYTTNGAEPTLNSPTYNNPLNVSSTTTIKAKGFKDGWTPSATASATYTINVNPPGQMILVQGGTVAGITVSSFYIDKYELTQAGYQAVMGSDPASGNGDGDTYPVYYVSWFNAIEYSNRRSLQEGLTPCYSYSTYGTNPDNWPAGWNSNSNNAVNVSCSWIAGGYRLPSEAEWEYAARGGLQTHGYTYSGSNDLNAVGWYWDNWGASTYSTHTVGALAPNELGIYDLSGNVWEWCWDVVSGSTRVLRGGGWYNYANYCTVSYRRNVSATFSGVNIGFRCVRVSP